MLGLRIRSQSVAVHTGIVAHPLIHLQGILTHALLAVSICTCAAFVLLLHIIIVVIIVVIVIVIVIVVFVIGATGPHTSVPIVHHATRLASAPHKLRCNNLLQLLL